MEARAHKTEVARAQDVKLIRLHGSHLKIIYMYVSSCLQSSSTKTHTPQLDICATNVQWLFCILIGCIFRHGINGRSP